MHRRERDRRVGSCSQLTCLVIAATQRDIPGKSARDSSLQVVLESYLNYISLAVYSHVSTTKRF